LIDESFFEGRDAFTEFILTDKERELDTGSVIEAQANPFLGKVIE
jgi:hypothetical protein